MIQKLLKRCKSKKGETIVEVLVSTAILAILSTFIIQLVMSCFKTNMAAKALTDKSMMISAGIDGDAGADFSEQSSSTSLKIKFGGTTLTIDGAKKKAEDTSNPALNNTMTYFVPD